MGHLNRVLEGCDGFEEGSLLFPSFRRCVASAHARACSWPYCREVFTIIIIRDAVATGNRPRPRNFHLLSFKST